MIFQRYFNIRLLLSRGEVIALYWRTVKFLKPVQVFARIWFRAFLPSHDLSPAPMLKSMGLRKWIFPARRSITLVAPERFSFFFKEGELAEIAWSGGTRDKLWRYNQHYFDDLNAFDASERLLWHRALLRRWIIDNPPFLGGEGWDPYPTSMRIVNWIKWSFSGNELSAECVHSLAIQARWLMCRLEWHLLGNHLFANGKALIFAGLYFEGREAKRWLEKGISILAKEVPEQILPDGGHFELSTMYHALALEDMLDLVNVARFCDREDLAVEWVKLIPGMINWLLTMSHPDGQIAFFNDAAFGVAPDNEELLGYAYRLGFAIPEAVTGLCQLAESGYIRLSSDAMVVIADFARIGPDYLPGHAHADTLSFEMSVFGHRVFVNSGTSEYGLGIERLRQRGTAAHNTVVVDGENSSEVWSGFRVARRAYPRNIKIFSGKNFQSISACHDGYKRLSSPVEVCRSIKLSSDGLLIEDMVDGCFVEAVSHFYLHPSVSASHSSDDLVVLHLAGAGRLLMSFQGASRISIYDSTWHPRFGMIERNQRISVEIAEGRLSTYIEFCPL